jgi:hypothetical protein
MMPRMASVRDQLRSNAVAIVSLVVALAALGYNTWRNELTERNRNFREAGFALLGEIGSLQQVVFYAHFQPGDARGDARMGWADVLTISDLAELLPPDVRRDARALRDTWQADWDGLGRDARAHRRVDESIEVLRQTTLVELRKLR